MKLISNIKTLFLDEGMTIKKVLIAGIFSIAMYQLSIIAPTISELSFFYECSYIIAALAMIYFLRLNNSGKKCFIPISISIFILYFLLIIQRYDFLWMPSFGIFVFYSLRFWYKQQKVYLDIFKFFVIILFLSIPILMDRYDKEPDNRLTFYAMSSGIIYLVMFFIYIIESIAISQFFYNHKQKMKKFIIPVLIIQSIVSIGFLLFSIVKTIEAQEARVKAEMQKVLAVKSAEEAKKQKKIVEHEKNIFETRIKILEDSIRSLKRK